MAGHGGLGGVTPAELLTASLLVASLQLELANNNNNFGATNATTTINLLGGPPRRRRRQLQKQQQPTHNWNQTTNDENADDGGAQPIDWLTERAEFIHHATTRRQPRDTAADATATTTSLLKLPLQLRHADNVTPDAPHVDDDYVPVEDDDYDERLVQLLLRMRLVPDMERDGDGRDYFGDEDVVDWLNDGAAARWLLDDLESELAEADLRSLALDWSSRVQQHRNHLPSTQLHQQPNHNINSNNSHDKDSSVSTCPLLRGYRQLLAAVTPAISGGGTAYAAANVGDAVLGGSSWAAKAAFHPLPISVF